MVGVLWEGWVGLLVLIKVIFVGVMIVGWVEMLVIFVLFFLDFWCR